MFPNRNLWGSNQNYCQRTNECCCQNRNRCRRKNNCIEGNFRIRTNCNGNTTVNLCATDGCETIRINGRIENGQFVA